MIELLEETIIFISEFRPLGLLVLFMIAVVATSAIVASTQSVLRDEDANNEKTNHEIKSVAEMLKDKELRKQITDIIEGVSASIGVDFVQIMSYQVNSYDPALLLNALDTIIPKHHSMMEDLRLYAEAMDSMELDAYERKFMFNSLTDKLDEFVPLLKNDIASEYERLKAIRDKEIEERLGFKNVKDSVL